MQISNKWETGAGVRAIVAILMLVLFLPSTLASAQSDSLEEAARLTSELEKLYQQGRYDEAIPLGERALAIREKILGKVHAQIAESLNNLAVLYEDKGDYGTAVPLYERALAVTEKVYGAEAIEIADMAEKLALLHDNQASYAKAEPLYLRVLSIREKVLGKEHADVAISLNNLAELYRNIGDYERAEPLHLRALAIKEKVYGEVHANTAITLNNLALLYQDKGDYAKAERLFLRALAIREKVLGADDPDTALSLNNLALLYEGEGDYAKAEPLFLRTLELVEKALGKEHPDTAQPLNNLAILYRAKGDYGKAEPLFMRALAICEKSFGVEHPKTATVLHNLAGLYKDKGDFARAEPLFLRALAIREKVLGANHPDTARHFSSLAWLYEGEGDYAKAEPLFLRALAISERTLGREHPYTATSLNNLAGLYYLKGDFARAEPLFLRALAIQESQPGAEHPDTAVSLNNLASLYKDKGDYAKAEPLYRRALAIYEKTLGTEHPDTAHALRNLAGLYQAMGNFSQAVALQTRCNEISEKDFIRNLSTGSEHQRLLYLNKTAHYLDFTLTLHNQFAPNDLPARQMALRVILQRKGRVMDATTDAVAALRRRASADDQKLLDQLIIARSQLSNATLKGAGKEGVARHQANLKNLGDEVEKLEAELSRRSAEFRAQASPVTLEAVQAAVPADAALIEFASFESYDAKTQTLGASRYAAYLLTNSGEIKWADLGEAAKIEKAVKEFRAVLHQQADGSLSDLGGKVKPRARALDELIMRPVRALLGDKKRLLISPDGALNLIPFDALVDEKNHYLVESYSISYLTSGRDLLRLQTAKPNNKTALVFADPDFDLGATPVKAGTTSDTRIAQRVDQTQNDKERIAKRVDNRPGPRLGNVELQPFERLPGSAKEGAELKSLLPSATILTAAQATETALKHASSPSILHISTHGGFLEDAPQPEAKEQRGLLIRPAGTGDFDEALPSSAKAEDALLRSGLFFAGANRGLRSDDDGVLTALEAKDLDLYGTKLVVLSACDTGVGEVKNGDGVYGLRRALVLAGSETQVMSLWSVSDEGTRELMIDYYKRLLNGEGRGEALRQVRLQMLKNPQRQHPYYWASFIQSGEWANLDGKR